MSSPFPLFAFYVLECKLAKIPPKYSFTDFQKALNYTKVDPPSPLFVTWNKGKSMQLRGCIGTFSPLNLEQGVKAYSLTAALEDHRFSPIKLKEMSDLSVSVTLLQNFEDAIDVYDWTLGKHGIRISFNQNGRNYGATFLPEVATEQGWDQDETLRHLVNKAGSDFEDLEINDIKLIRYEGIKSKADYAEYKEFIESL